MGHEELNNLSKKTIQEQMDKKKKNVRMLVARGWNGGIGYQTPEIRLLSPRRSFLSKYTMFLNLGGKAKWYGADSQRFRSHCETLSSPVSSIS